MKQKIVFMITGCLVAFCVSGCGSKKDQDNGNQSSEVSYVVPLGEVSNGQCLNVERLFTRLRAVSTATMVRRFSTTFNVQAASVPKPTEADATPSTEFTTSHLRDNFARFLAKNTFIFKEEPLHNFIEDFGVMKQDGCDAVHFLDDTGLPEDFRVLEFSNDSIRFENAGQRSYFIKLTDPQSMEIRAKRRAIDFCSATDQAEVEYTQVVRWGSSDIFEKIEELVSIEFMNKLANALSQVPASIRSASGGSAPQWTTSIPVADLKAAMEIPAPTYLQDCPVTSSDGPGGAVEPSPAPVEPSPGATSDPSSTIDPNANEGGGDSSH